MSGYPGNMGVLADAVSRESWEGFSVKLYDVLEDSKRTAALSRAEFCGHVVTGGCVANGGIR